MRLPTSRMTGALRGHLDDQLYRTGYYLILGTGVTSLLGVAFWALAARLYGAHAVGLNAAAISAMTLVSGVCSLGLSAVLIRYLPISGTATRLLVVRSYAITLGLSLVCGLGVALTSPLWSPSLSFLQEPEWLIGFVLATGGTTIFTLQDSVLTGLRAARWIPLENSLYSTGKLVLLAVTAGLLPIAGPFVAWNAPLLPAVVLVNWLILRRLLPRFRSHGSLERNKVLRMAAGNYTGNLFGLFANMYIPILVANQTSPTEAAYFYVPWLISLSLQLVALNVMSSLTVEAALDLAGTGRLARRALAHAMRLVVPLAALTAFLAPVGLLIFGQAYADEGTTLLRVLALGAIPNVVVALGLTIARIEHRAWTLLIAQGAHTVLLISLGAVLLSSNGIEGIGIAWTASQTLIALVMLAGILRPLLFGSTPGGTSDPDALAAARVEGVGAELVIVVPVLRRPQNVKPLLESIRSSTPEARVMFVADPGDDAEHRAIEEEGAEMMIVNGNYARKINRAVEETEEPLIFQGADDLRFHPGWLEAAKRRLTPGIGVVGTNDLSSKRVMAGTHATHSLITREYAERGTIDNPGKVLHEGYMHEYVDDEFIQTAIHRGAFAHASDSIVEHLHPFAGKAEKDELYSKAGRRLLYGRLLFMWRKRLWA